jgi:sialate O-acetylesterase
MDRFCSSTLRLLAIAIGGSVFLSAGSLPADVKLPALFSDHMVLQADADVPIWGWANPGEEVAVTLADTKGTVKAGADGKWQVILAKLKAGGPYALEVKGINTLTVKDVLVGEVWLGSGQSNMAMVVSRVKDLEEEKAAARLPKIRMFTVTSGGASTAQDDCRGEWVVCSPETVSQFSATAYFFGRELHKELGVPVGLINSSVGGTPIESWISPEAQAAAPELKPMIVAAEKAEANFDEAKAKAKYERDLAQFQEATKKAKADGKPQPKRPQDPLAVRNRRGNVGGLFNGKIAPLVPYRIRGALWYQGEANSTPEKAPYYQYQLPLLIRDWRSRWGYDFPVGFVQLPNFGGPGRNWPEVREAMLKTLQVPGTGMAITIDIGEVNDIHPKNKQDVGKRLALWALGTVYGKSVATSGPLPAGVERRGQSIAVSFQHAQGGLVAKGGELTGFEIAGADQKFQPATARIDGDKVIAMNPDVKEPAFVRYAWENNPQASLFNGAGLPASPFRSTAGK